jgi:hypothetical protein
VGYLHIANLYKSQDILLFRECYALEKIHGTSAHVEWRDDRVWFSAGGESHARFVALFDEASLTAKFIDIGAPRVTVFGEAYGGKQQGQSRRYGKDLRFVAFDVLVGDSWLVVPAALDVVVRLGLEFVDFVKIPTEPAAIDAERDYPSTQARRNGVEGHQTREGVVLRPLIEVIKNNGERVIAKHKRDDERETKTPRKVVDPAQLEVLTAATRIADEWVTATRLSHVLDKVGHCGIERTQDVIAAMVEDVMREGAGELVDSREARQAIGRKAAEMFHARLKAALRDGGGQ